MAWQYKTIYVDARGRISAEGVEETIERGERQSGFIRGYLNELGLDGWELTGLHHLGMRQTAYYIFKKEGEGPGRKQLRAENATRAAAKAADVAEEAKRSAEG